MTLVALSAAYGAGGGRIGPALAERLEVPFLDRAIPNAVAAELSVSVDEAVAFDYETSRSWLERVLSGFIGSDTGAPAPLLSEGATGEDFRRATEEILRRQADTGNGVILGRCAVVVLGDDDRLLRVRLHGPRDGRIRQAMRVRGVDEETATDTIRRLDRTHAAYLKHFYGADIDDPTLYHLMIDSTAIGIDACVDLIVRARTALAGD
jgi:cytidylate kinase